MSSLLLRMLFPLTLLAATGIPVDPACASTTARGNSNCGRGEVREIAKNTKEVAVPAAGKLGRDTHPEAL